MNKRLFLPLLLLLVPVLLPGQIRTHNTTLFDTLNPGSAGSPWNYSGLTGYAAPNGREYALLGGYYGTHIIDITEKPIREVAFIAGVHSGWRELKTFRTYAYVVSEGGDGLQIIDLSQLPTKATLVRSDQRYFNTAHTIDQEGDYIYINGTKAEAEANGGTIILNVSKSPTDPTLVGKWTGRYVHDATIRNDTLYAAAINDGALDVVYLGTDRKNPVQVTEISYPGAGTHNCDLSSDGRYILTTDEIHSTPKTLKIWDRRDIGNITKVADFTPVPGEIVHNVHVKGNLAVVAWYTAGTRIIDISDPANPAELGFFDEWGGPGGGFRGNWEVYPWLPSGKIILSDMTNGLYVFTFSGVQRGSVSGIVRDEKSGNPVAGATISFPEIGQVITSDASGHYSLSGAFDTLRFIASKSDYTSRTGSIILTAAGREQEILLTPMDDVELSVVDDAAGTLLPNFSYRVVTRPASDGNAVGNNPTTLRLSEDTTYSIEVAAWGFLPRTVQVNAAGGNVVSVRLEHGYADDAELDLGWRFDAEDTTGLWGRGVPVTVSLQTTKGKVTMVPALDHTPGPGDHAFMTGSGSDAEHLDVDGAVLLTSPLFDLSTYSDPYVNFSLWFATAHPLFVGDDTLRVLLSNNDGQSWQQLTTVSNTLTSWREYRLRVSDLLTPTSTMRFRVVAFDGARPTSLTAGLDDFSVTDGLGAGTGSNGSAAGGATARFYPNPVTADGALSVTLDHPADRVRLELYDLLGRRVSLVHEGPMQQGITIVPVDLRPLSAGEYVWRMSLDDGTIVGGKVMVVR
jgi:choice-of-anchor B domain-containing protein